MIDNKMNAGNDLDITQYLPHRPPFLFVDKILAIEQEQIHAQMIVKQHLNMFEGHFPGNMVLPGVLMVEALAQAGCILMKHNYDNTEQSNGTSNISNSSTFYNSHQTYLTKIEQAAFKKLVTPEDTLDLIVTVSKQRVLGNNSYFMFEGFAKVVDDIACSAKFSAVLVKVSSS